MLAFAVVQITMLSMMPSVSQCLWQVRGYTANTEFNRLQMEGDSVSLAAEALSRSDLGPRS